MSNNCTSCFKIIYFTLISSHLVPDQWKVLPTLRWRGEVTTEEGNYLTLVNTCTIDNFTYLLYFHLWLCACYYSIHPDLLIEIRNSKVNVLSNFYVTLVHLISGNYNEAKYGWLMCCKERIRVVSEGIKAEGSDKILSFIPLKQCFKRRYFFTCNSPHGPTKNLNSHPVNFTYNMLDLPETTEEIGN